jgi:large subunit ribosomal protein L30
MARLRITLTRGLIGCTERQRETVRTLGLRSIRDQVERDDTPAVRGAVRAIAHLVDVEEVSA